MAKKSTTKRKKANEREPMMERLVERRGVRTAGLVLLGLVTLGLLGGAGYGVWSVDAKARSVLGTKLQRVEIIWPMRTSRGDHAHVLSSLVRDELQSQVEAIVNHEADPFSSQTLAMAGEWLTMSGWFDGVPMVARVDSETIRIEGAWRRPVALVRHGHGDDARDYLIDEQLRLLPKVYAVGERTESGSGGGSVGDGGGGRYLTGATYNPAGNAPWQLDFTTPWPDQSLAAGLELLNLLMRQPFAGQVAGVDVRDYFVEHRLEIITDRGTRVVWGGPVGEFIPGEADTQQKLTHLLQFFNDPTFGRRIDAGLERLEVFDRQVVIDRSGRR